MKLSVNVLRKRVFKQHILDLHLKDFMLGQTTPYLNLYKNTIDVGAATGMYASHFAQHSKNVICFEAVPPVNFRGCGSPHARESAHLTHASVT